MSIYVETIFETGSKAVGCYEDEAELMTALKAHHAKAVTGEEGGPTGHPAERITRVEIYDRHPDDLPEPSPEVVKEELKSIEGDTVMEVAAKVRDLSSPMVNDPERHDSMFKMEAKKVLTKGWEAA